MKLLEIFLLLVLTGSATICRCQQTYVAYVVEKDTLKHGQKYRCDAVVHLADGDSIIQYEVTRDGMPQTVEQSRAHIEFVAYQLKPPFFRDTREVKEFSLQIKIKTVQLDTLMEQRVPYVVKSGPAYLRFLSEHKLSWDAVVYPDKEPSLMKQKADPGEYLLSTLLKGKKGELVITYVVNTSAKIDNVNIHYNSFPTSEEEIIRFISGLAWSVGENKGKPVNTVSDIVISR